MMTKPKDWNNPSEEGDIDIEVGGEFIKYNPESGKVYTLQTYLDGEFVERVKVYKTGRGVVKFLVEGVSYRAMDVIHQNYYGVALANTRAYPANGKFTDLRLKNIVMVRTRAPVQEGGE